MEFKYYYGLIAVAVLAFAGYSAFEDYNSTQLKLATIKSLQSCSDPASGAKK